MHVQIRSPEQISLFFFEGVTFKLLRAVPFSRYRVHLSGLDRGGSMFGYWLDGQDGDDQPVISDKNAQISTTFSIPFQFTPAVLNR